MRKITKLAVLLADKLEQNVSLEHYCYSNLLGVNCGCQQIKSNSNFKTKRLGHHCWSEIVKFKACDFWIQLFLRCSDDDDGDEDGDDDDNNNNNNKNNKFRDMSCWKRH